MHFRDQIEWQIMIDRLNADDRRGHAVRWGSRPESRWGPWALGIAGVLLLLTSLPMFSIALVIAGSMMVLAASLWRDWLRSAAAADAAA